MEDTDEPLGLADVMIMRGLHLKYLRRLANEDEYERNNDDTPDTVSEYKDEIIVLPSGSKLLKYESFLQHQTFYDDLKHANYKFMEYGNFTRRSNDNGIMGEENHPQLIIEQEKGLGKGGLCWDAAYILGEYLITHEDFWNNNQIKDPPTRVLELGAGTGLTGMMVAKACECHVHITDLPKLQQLMEKNMARNFKNISPELSTVDEQYLDQSFSRLKHSQGSLSVGILDWADPTTYPTDNPWDTIIGADIVASLYDPVALVDTMYTLSSSSTKLFISGKTRLDLPHQIFETELRKKFSLVERISLISCRHRNPDVFLFIISDKVI